ncbi:type II toxin-antitoxin system VapC family toxin [Fimbriimonas ginsengisoli]|uniref:type II toxin-antitoxin system VapC family toxin n=1 Tax=Fimbriimonas ginsengisoli TaxID=1005039 RepID=UPI000571D76E
MGRGEGVVLDTHMWIWFHKGDSRLPPELAREIERLKGTVALSSVSIWEALLAIQRGRIVSSLSPEVTVRSWLSQVPMRVIPLDLEIALLSRTLPFAHEDPADRFIAATAYHLRVPLATADSKLRALPWLTTLG